MKKTFLAIISLFTLVACSSEESSLQDVVRNRLIDPSSAQFKDFVINNKEDKACVAVNAKNRMGGYTGFNLVELEKRRGQWDIVTMEGSWENCTEQHFAIRDEWENYKEKYPEGPLVENGDYLGDEALEEILMATKNFELAGKKTGLSDQEIKAELYKRNKY